MLARRVMYVRLPVELPPGTARLKKGREEVRRREEVKRREEERK